MIICLIPLLSSCAKDPQVIRKTEYIYLTPPNSWIKQRELEQTELKTNEDLLDQYMRAKEVIKLHNKDKRAIQLWKETVPKKSKEIKKNN